MERSLILKFLILIILLAGCSIPTTPTVITYHVPSSLRNTQETGWFESIVQVDSFLSRGSGFVVGIDPEWVYIMTVKHLVEDQISVQVNGQAATVLAIAAEHDLAVIKTANHRIFCRIYEFAQPTLGLDVWAVGYGTWFVDQIRLVHRGWIVSLDLTNPEGNWVVTHNAGGRGGMSGGPLFDKNRRVVGICSFFADTGLDNTINVSELCAVPGSSAAVFWQQVKTDEGLLDIESISTN